MNAILPLCLFFLSLAGATCSTGSECNTQTGTSQCSSKTSTIPCDTLSTLAGKLPVGSVVFPGDDEYQETIDNGNLRFSNMTPSAVVIPQTTAHVATTVQFAVQHSIHLTVKLGGHSNEGYYFNNGGIVVDLKSMKQISLDSTTMRMTIQTGSTWRDVYEYLENNYVHLMVVGGLSPTGGVAGYTLGGGISAFSRKFGLGVDNVWEMEVVTADGQIRTLSKEQPGSETADLFWGMLGGGEGNFAVMTKFTTQVHELANPRGIVTEAQFCWHLPQSHSDFRGVMSHINSWVRMPEQISIFPRWSYDYSNAKQFTACMEVFINDDRDDFIDDILNLFYGFNPTSHEVEHMTWFNFETRNEGHHPPSTKYHSHASFIFGFGAATNAMMDVIEELVAGCPTISTDSDEKKCHILWDHIGGQTRVPKPTDTAFFWRNGFYVMKIRAVWLDPSRETVMTEWMNLVKEKLSPFAIDQVAAYTNYVDWNLNGWQKAYYGDNYPRLQQVKAKWDPRNFFRFNQSIELAAPSNMLGAVQSDADIESALEERTFDTLYNDMERPSWSGVVTALVDSEQIRLVRGVVIPLHTGDRKSPPRPYNGCPTGRENKMDKGHLFAVSNGGVDARENIVPQADMWQRTGGWRDVEVAAMSFAVLRYGWECDKRYLKSGTHELESPDPDIQVLWEVAPEEYLDDCQPQVFRGNVSVVDSDEIYSFTIETGEDAVWHPHLPPQCEDSLQHAEL